MSEARAPAIPTRYSRTLLLRGVVLWAVSRLMVKVLYMFISANAGSETTSAFTQGNPLLLTAWTLVLTAALVRLDLYRRHEVALLNNLGVITSHAVAVGTVPALLLETALTILR